MKPLFRFLSCLLCLAVLLSSVACNDSYKDAYIYYELNSVPKTLDPQLVKTDDEATVVRCLFDTLLRYDEEGKLVPSAAESYSNEGLIYTFKLKKDATWTNGKPVTAYDFQFGLRRAVDPNTMSPLAYTLSAINNADKILSGKMDISKLGVTVIDDYTLKIELSKEDSEFLNTLTTPIAMPCNEDFFKNAKATYGLTLDSLLCNGSYYVRIWETNESFLLRLAKNLDFKGNFEANSMRVYFTCSDSENTLKIADGDSDLGFIMADKFTDAAEKGLETVNIENQCYMLTVGGNIDLDLRKALLTSVDTNSYKNEISGGYRLANNIYPASLNVKNVGNVSENIVYDINSASKLYNSIIKKQASKNLVLKYVNDPICENVAKAIAAHWQQHLSAFINIEKVSLDSAYDIYKNGNSLLIMPFSVSGGNYKAYISALGSKNPDSSAAQNEILKDYLHLPLFFSNNYIAFNGYIKMNENLVSNGIPDMALVIKNK